MANGQEAVPQIFCEGCPLAKVEPISSADADLMDHARLSLGGIADELHVAEDKAEDNARDFDEVDFEGVADTIVNALNQPYLDPVKKRSETQRAYASCKRRIGRGACKHF